MSRMSGFLMTTTEWTSIATLKPSSFPLPGPNFAHLELYAHGPDRTVLFLDQFGLEFPKLPTSRVVVSRTPKPEGFKVRGYPGRAWTNCTSTHGDGTLPPLAYIYISRHGFLRYVPNPRVFFCFPGYTYSVDHRLRLRPLSAPLLAQIMVTHVRVDQEGRLPM